MTDEPMKRIAGYIIDALFIAAVTVGAVVLLTGCSHVTPTAAQATGEAIVVTRTHIATAQREVRKVLPNSEGDAKVHLETVDVELVAADQSAADAQESFYRVVKQLASALSEGTKKLRSLQVICVIAVGGFVAFGFFVKDYRISAIGIAAALATGITAQLFVWFTADSFGKFFWWGISGAIAVCLAWLLIEWKLRGSLSAAIKSNPIKDIQDLFNRHAAAGGFVVPSPAVAPPAIADPRPVDVGEIEPDAETQAALTAGGA